MTHATVLIDPLLLTTSILLLFSNQIKPSKKSDFNLPNGSNGTNGKNPEVIVTTEINSHEPIDKV